LRIDLSNRSKVMAISAKNSKKDRRICHIHVDLALNQQANCANRSVSCASSFK